MTAQEPAKAANPAPLGLAAFGLTTVVLSCVNGGLIRPKRRQSSCRWLLPMADSRRSSRESWNSSRTIHSARSRLSLTVAFGGGTRCCCGPWGPDGSRRLMRAESD